MDKAMSDFKFKAMSFIFKIRDIISPPQNILKEANIKSGYSILDYGCGPGAYTIIAAKIVGETGKVYALDIHKLAIQQIQNLASKKGLSNIETICSDCTTGLPENSIDVIILYDIFHMFSNPTEILEELHRILKQDGMLTFTDPHLKEDKIIAGMTNNNLFKLSQKGNKTHTY